MIKQTIKRTGLQIKAIPEFIEPAPSPRERKSPTPSPRSMTRNGFRFCTEDQALDAFEEWRSDRYGEYFMFSHKLRDENLHDLFSLQKWCTRVYDSVISRVLEAPLVSKDLMTLVEEQYTGNTFHDYNETFAAYRYLHSLSIFLKMYAFVERYADMKQDRDRLDEIIKKYSLRMEEVRKISEKASLYYNAIRVIQWMYRKEWTPVEIREKLTK